MRCSSDVVMREIALAHLAKGFSIEHSGFLSEQDEARRDRSFQVCTVGYDAFLLALGLTYFALLLPSNNRRANCRGFAELWPLMPANTFGPLRQPMPHLFRSRPFSLRAPAPCDRARRSAGKVWNGSGLPSISHRPHRTGAQFGQAFLGNSDLACIVCLSEYQQEEQTAVRGQFLAGWDELNFWCGQTSLVSG
jgi:hypothetical protein